MKEEPHKGTLGLQGKPFINAYEEPIKGLFMMEFFLLRT